MYDLCIVGAGMIGSAAARHASSIDGLQICVIGPEEPREKRTLNSSRDIFGAHYDEGRITRCTDTDPVWGILAQRSIARYRELERLSGIQFYREVGCLMSGDKGGNYVGIVKTNANKQNIKFDNLNSEQLNQRFPYLNMSPTDEHVFQYKNAGYFSPRNMIAAQLKIAVQNGCHLIRDAARDVRRRVGKRNESVMEVVTDTGKTILAKKVLLATGAFTNFRNILEEDAKLEMIPCALTIGKVEVSASDAEKISDMPPVLYKGKGADNWSRKFPRVDNIISYYILPPVLYPNGKYYIKLGHFHDSVKRILQTTEEVKDWFCSYGNPDLVKASTNLIYEIVKGIKPLSVEHDSCVRVQTPTNRPYIDMIHPQLGVATAGNGKAAKSSDEIGRIAAMMVVKNTWDSDIAHDKFKVVFKRSKARL